MQALTEWNPWWTGKTIDPEILGKPRELTGNVEDLLSFREIKVLIGLRRSGKSTLLYQFVNHLLEQIPARADVYVVKYAT